MATRTYCILIFLIQINFGNAQTCLNDIDYNKIEQKEIKDLLHKQQEFNVYCISDIESTCQMDDNLVSYHKQTKTYSLNDSIENVWREYSTVSPARVYHSKRLSFGLMLCKNKSKQNIFYSSDAINKVEKGQVIYVKLRFLKGLYRMAVAFEILQVDSVHHTIDFSYVKGGNKSIGLQRISFEKGREGKTKIIHTSYYKCQMKIREKLLYPFFHARITNEFHRNLKSIFYRKDIKQST